MPASLIPVMVDAAYKAGQHILEFYGKDILIEKKPDHSPVTIADQLAEKTIIDILEKAAPSLPIIAEEKVACGFHPQHLPDSFFLVDPLDGTKEFIAQNGEFTVNIALIHKNTPVLGVIYVPVRHLLYIGSPSGAYVRSGNYEEKIHARCIQTPPTIVASRSHRSPKTDEWINSHKPHTLLTIGSSLKFALLAEGKADFYPRFEPCMEWDTAAGDAILRAAGGCIHDCHGKPLQYGKRNPIATLDFRQDFFIAKAMPEELTTSRT